MKSIASKRYFYLYVFLVIGVVSGVPTDGLGQKRGLPSADPTVRVSPVPRIPVPPPIRSVPNKLTPQAPSSSKVPSKIFEPPKGSPRVRAPKIFPSPKTSGSGIFGRPQHRRAIETKPANLSNRQKLERVRKNELSKPKSPKASQRSKKSAKDSKRISGKYTPEEFNVDLNQLKEEAPALSAEAETVLIALEDAHEVLNQIVFGPPHPCLGCPSTPFPNDWPAFDPSGSPPSDPPGSPPSDPPESPPSDPPGSMDSPSEVELRQIWADNRERKKEEKEMEIKEMENRLLLIQLKWEMLKRDRMNARKHLPSPRR